MFDVEIDPTPIIIFWALTFFIGFFCSLLVIKKLKGRKMKSLSSQILFSIIFGIAFTILITYTPIFDYWNHLIP
jgi:MFS superfamily sulfate permease-like transporter